MNKHLFIVEIAPFSGVVEFHNNKKSPPIFGRLILLFDNKNLVTARLPPHVNRNGNNNRSVNNYTFHWVVYFNGAKV